VHTVVNILYKKISTSALTESKSRVP